MSGPSSVMGFVCSMNAIAIVFLGFVALASATTLSADNYEASTSGKTVMKASPAGPHRFYG